MQSIVPVAGDLLDDAHSDRMISNATKSERTDKTLQQVDALEDDRYWLEELSVSLSQSTEIHSAKSCAKGSGTAVAEACILQDAPSPWWVNALCNLQAGASRVCQSEQLAVFANSCSRAVDGCMVAKLLLCLLTASRH